jgi:hypothetical protein
MIMTDINQFEVLLEKQAQRFEAHLDAKLEELGAMVNGALIDQEQRLRAHVSEEVGGARDDIAHVERKLNPTIAVTDRLDERATRLEQHVGLPPLEPAGVK